MTEIKRRAPVAITINSPAQAPKIIDARAPRAVPAAKVIVTQEQSFDDPDQLSILPIRQEKRFPFGTIFISSSGALFMVWMSSALYNWLENLILTKPQIGWFAAGLAVLTALTLFGFIAREIFAVMRLSGNQKLRLMLEDAAKTNNTTLARSSVTDLLKISESLPATAQGRTVFLATDREFLSAGDLISLAERDLIAPLDKIAIERVTTAAKRVSIVTAVSPRAFVDIAYVLYENAKLVRAVAEIYGCRPGIFGFLRLSRETLTHLAVTGVVAMGDSIIQQMVGHGMAARVSAKLGEGVLNGLMTARIGFAAMEVTRPAPFSQSERPKITQVLSVLNPITGKQAAN